MTCYRSNELFYPRLFLIVAGREWSIVHAYAESISASFDLALGEGLNVETFHMIIGSS